MTIFDFDELERVEGRYVAAHLSPFRMKAMAMKLRHKAHGFNVARAESGASRRKFSKMSADMDPLREPLNTLSEVTPQPTIEEASPTSKKFQSDERPEPSPSEAVVLDNRDNLLGLKGIFFHPFCIPLVCVPLGLVSSSRGWGDTATFWLNFLALVPLAKILGDATEELAAAWRNDTLSGLLNATFGNAVELIVSIQSIRAGLFVVVKASLLGSVLSNILLVLGSSFFLGGLTRSSKRRGRNHSFNDAAWATRCVGLEKEQKFPVKSALISMGMLLFACCVIVLPTIFNALPSDDTAEVLKVSRVGSWIMMSCYIAYLGFQLLTHSVTLQIEEAMETRRHIEGTDSTKDPFADEEDDDEEDAAIDPSVAILLMLACTVVVALNSELLVDSINSVVAGSSLSIGFIGVILLPIAGNACEHASAIRFSMRDRPGLAIGIAVGSSTQVALLVVPASVLIAQALGQPLDLDYGMMNVAILTFTVLVVLVMLMDGRSNWFKGYILVALYVFIGALYLYVPHGFGGDADPA